MWNSLRIWPTVILPRGLFEFHIPQNRDSGLWNGNRTATRPTKVRLIEIVSIKLRIGILRDVEHILRIVDVMMRRGCVSHPSESGFWFVELNSPPSYVLASSILW